MKWMLLLSLLALMSCVLAQTAEKAELISDKRFERLTWFEGNTYCVYRSLLSGAPTILWDGGIRLVSTSTVEYKTVVWQEEVVDYDCSDVDKLTGEPYCIVIGKHNESRSRTDAILSPLKPSEKADLSQLALDVKTSVLPSAESFEAVKSATEVRWCFYVPLNVKERGAHISYIVQDGEKYDACESTYVNITSGSLSFQNPTPANNSWVNQNWSEANISIVTDNLGTFLFNWNGTNYSIYDDSLVLALNFNNNSEIGENATQASDSSRYNNSFSGAGSSGYESTLFGNALKCNAVNAWSGIMPVNTTDKITIILRVRVIDVSQPLANPGFFYSSKFSFDYTNSSKYPRFLITGGNTLSFAKMNDTLFHTLVFTQNGSNSKAYSDGVLSDTQTNINISYLTPTFGFCRGWSDRISASFDYLRIYNRSLSADEIAMHYQMEFQKYNASEYRFYNNITNLSQGTYSYYGWANDTAGNSASTGTRQITVGVVPDQYLNVSLLWPPNGTVSTETSWNLSWLRQGTITSATAFVYVNNSLNASISSANNTTNNLSVLFSPGVWQWYVNVTGPGLNNTNVSNVSGTFWLTVETTTTTTTTTTSSTSTTTSLPIALGSNQGILWIYAVLLPCFALITTLAAFYFTQKQVLACLTSSIFASILWFISSLTTSNIIFINNFTVTSSPYYTHLGNTELGYLFMGFGILMALYTILIIMNRISQSQKGRETNG